MEWVSSRDRLPEDFVEVVVLTYNRDLKVSSIQNGNIEHPDHTRTSVKTWHGIYNAQVEYWLDAPPFPKKNLSRKDD